jgi:hypothetical protein
MRFLSTMLAVAAAASIAACTSAPIMNVDQNAVVTASGKALSAEQVKSAIIRAGAGLGWQMKDAGPGLLVGTIQLREHTAVVDIPYTASAYSIKYKSSVNLKESGGSIHKNYNGWIQNLTKAITSQLSAS